jgi:protein-S-isoprenylcysteine O-methyltransferase Ste14
VGGSTWTGVDQSPGRDTGRSTSARLKRRRPNLNRGNAVALLHGLTGAAVMVVSLSTKEAFLASAGFITSLGFAVFAPGILLFAISAGYLKSAFQGHVEPVTHALITAGPYAYVRHPLYLAMDISTFGIGLGLRSLWGILMSVLVFFPLGVYRARLEEKALALRFGEEWEDYTRRTGFMLPPM